MISSRNRKFRNSAKKIETAQIFVTDPLDQSLPENQDFGEQIWRYRDPGSLRIITKIRVRNALTTSGSSRSRDGPHDPMVDFRKSTHGPGLYQFSASEKWWHAPFLALRKRTAAWQTDVTASKCTTWGSGRSSEKRLKSRQQYGCIVQPILNYLSLDETN